MQCDATAEHFQRVRVLTTLPQRSVSEVPEVLPTEAPPQTRSFGPAQSNTIRQLLIAADDRQMQILVAPDIRTPAPPRRVLVVHAVRTCKRSVSNANRGRRAEQASRSSGFCCGKRVEIVRRQTQRNHRRPNTAFRYRSCNARPASLNHGPRQSKSSSSFRNRRGRPYCRTFSTIPVRRGPIRRLRQTCRRSDLPPPLRNCAGDGSHTSLLSKAM